MDEHIARLDERTEHIQSDIKDIKTDVREIKADIRNLEAKGNAQCLELKEVAASIKAGRSEERMWWLMIAAGILGVLARAMKWI